MKACSLVRIPTGLVLSLFLCVSAAAAQEQPLAHGCVSAKKTLSGTAPKGVDAPPRNQELKPHIWRQNYRKKKVTWNLRYTGLTERGPFTNAVFSCDSYEGPGSKNVIVYLDSRREKQRIREFKVGTTYPVKIKLLEWTQSTGEIIASLVKAEEKR